VSSKYVFEIENTIADPEAFVKNFSVIKISNKFTNETTKKELSFTVSTEIKKDDGDGDAGIEEEESDHEHNHHHGEDASVLGKSDDGATNTDALDASYILSANYLNEEKEEDESGHPVEHEIDTGKFTEMNNEESENITINHTVMVKVGTMDDVFIIDKADNEEV